jgi:basic membrane protein A
MMGRTGRPTLVAVALALALAVAGCGSDEGGGGAEPSAASGGDGQGKTLGLAMDVLRNDKSFGQATYEGASRAAKDLGLKLSVIDSLGAEPQKAQSALVNLARENDYVVNGAQALMSSMPRIARQYPDKQFAVYAVAVESSDNLHYAYQDWYPLAYLAGVVAARSTKSGTVGFVGGGEIPPTIAGEQAFKAAVEATDPDVEVVSTITGDFNDPAKGQDATAAQIAQGADVIYSFLDAAHEGAVAAAEEAGDVKLMSVVVPKCEGAEGIEIGDTVSRQDQLTYNLVKGMVEGNLTNTIYGIEDPEVANFEFCPGEGTPELEAEIEQVREQFASGELKTPPALRAEQGAEE